MEVRLCQSGRSQKTKDLKTSENEFYVTHWRTPLSLRGNSSREALSSKEPLTSQKGAGTGVKVQDVPFSNCRLPSLKQASSWWEEKLWTGWESETFTLNWTRFSILKKRAINNTSEDCKSHKPPQKRKFRRACLKVLEWKKSSCFLWASCWTQGQNLLGLD